MADDLATLDRGDYPGERVFYEGRHFPRRVWTLRQEVAGGLRSNGRPDHLVVFRPGGDRWRYRA